MCHPGLRQVSHLPPCADAETVTVVPAEPMHPNGNHDTVDRVCFSNETLSGQPVELGNIWQVQPKPDLTAALDWVRRQVDPATVTVKLAPKSYALEAIEVQVCKVHAVALHLEGVIGQPKPWPASTGAGRRPNIGVAGCTCKPTDE